jgi:hypothetical protein
MVMLILELFSWWFVQGWQQVAKKAARHMEAVSHVFSVPILLRTLLAPWRRIITYPGAGLDAKLRAFGDNLVSRCIGFTVRFLVLLTAGVILLLTAIYGLVSIVLWPFIPFLIIGLTVWGFVL